MTVIAPQIQFVYEGQSVLLEPRALRGVERLGDHARFDIELFAKATVTSEEILGAACFLELVSAHGRRTVHGVVASFTAVATSQNAPDRRYKLVMQSASWGLTLRRRCRVFQHMSVPDIIDRILTESGVAKEAPGRELSGEHEPREYVVQYDETDALFVRRLCEEEGLWLRFEAGEGCATAFMSDSVAGAPEPLEDALAVTEAAGVSATEARAFDVRAHRMRRSGWVTERDYNCDQPALALEAESKGGLEHEQAYEIYRAPDLSLTTSRLASRAQLYLESVRAEARSIEFETDAVALAPGVRVKLAVADDFIGSATPDGELFVVQVTHTWKYGGDLRYQVLATPASIPYRLPVATPKPKIHGLQSAVVTGAEGEEIHVDDAGRVRLHFHWDREGPRDHNSSLPVRVLQPNLAGSMLLPRVGWEVWVAFEDGDPDRPYVLGRAYEGIHVPPLTLPNNKTTTSVATPTSPGKGCRNAIEYEDAANKQGMNWNACTNLTRKVGNDMKSVTMGDESYWCGAMQSVTVNGMQKEAVGSVRVMSCDSQMITVAGNHTLGTPEAIDVKVGSETIAQANLYEYVGDPGAAAPDLIASVAFAVGSFLPSDGAQFALGVVKAAWAGYKETTTKGGVSGAMAFGKEALGLLPAPLSTGVEVFNSIADVAEGAELAPWQAGKNSWQLDEKTLKEADAAANKDINAIVGPLAGIGAPAPGAAGPGHRIHKVAGPAVEVIGGAYVVATPAASKWTTLGASSIGVGGTHSTTAGKTSWTSLGLSRISTGAMKINSSADVNRDLRGLTAAYADYSCTSSGGLGLAAKGDAKLTCGALTIDGKLTILVQGTEVIIEGGKVIVKAAKVTYKDTVNAAEAMNW